MTKKKFIYSLLASLVVLVFLTLYADYKVESFSKQYISEDLSKLEGQKTALVLGTSKYLKNGSVNDFFEFRINAAADLYKSGKVKYLIVSGDNSQVNYNEPLDMKNALVGLGIPDSVIFLDYAGLRTLDSVIRAKEIFGQTSYIIVSQKFHNERAVYIARKNGIEAYGYNAKEVTAFKGLKTKIREYIARDKVFIDLLFNISPKFAGDPVRID